MKIQVKRINNKGQFGEYPALKNVVSGSIYVDTTLGIARHLEHDKDGLNRHGDFVAYNIKGHWHTFNYEPECPLRQDIEFQLVD